MATDRPAMTFRIVPLHSAEAGDARTGGTAAERLAMVTELTKLGWELSGRPWPSFSRENTPVRVMRRGEHRDGDE